VDNQMAEMKNRNENPIVLFLFFMMESVIMRVKI